MEKRGTDSGKLGVDVPEVRDIVRAATNIEQHLAPPAAVIPVMPGSKVEVFTKAETSLARPGSLRQHEVIAACAVLRRP